MKHLIVFIMLLAVFTVAGCSQVGETVRPVVAGYCSGTDAQRQAVADALNQSVQPHTIAINCEGG